ncbi:hypothetical protein KM295_15055 [Natronomonas sp. F2-12]|uniref:Uncharacterized protein n=1 Tax=Natronomonas aquatica TaxID=2841590 RepID=A0A9R1CWK1_9EURY|nr:hypothetical protein [Natronomonas aquatica]MCQ4334771.1 hypothetical protein [Natronomonas aquatica]
MQDSEVHSLILSRLGDIEDDQLHSFLEEILQHEREILDEPRGQYKDEYVSIVDEYVDDNFEGK